MHKVITLTTDFGWNEYVAAMKGVIISINPDARIIDVSHTIKPQKVLEGAYVMYFLAPYFSNAIHVGVVDPGVGTERAGLIIECEVGFLVGPDNGLLIPCARRVGLKKIYRITNQRYFLDTVSDTFHGRDIYAPVAAHLSKGVDAKEIGEVIDEFVDLELEYHVEQDKTLEGKIIFVDSFGNLITSLPKSIIEKHLEFDNNVEIEFGSGMERIKKKVRFLKSYAFGEKGELLATISSGGFFEVSQNQDSAQRFLNVDVGSVIKLRF
ncbi:MAG: SAM-dependent chlorinase/fluorinase [Thermoplasmata archaeon]